jgi:hypothetical protein
MPQHIKDSFFLFTTDYMKTLSTPAMSNYIYTQSLVSMFFCRSILHIIFVSPVSLYTCYTHHIRSTSFSVYVLYTSYSQHQFLCIRAIHIMSCFQQFCMQVHIYIYIYIYYSSIPIKPNSSSRIWQSGPEPTRLRTVDARDTQRFHSEAALISISTRDNFRLLPYYLYYHSLQFIHICKILRYF